MRIADTQVSRASSTFATATHSESADEELDRNLGLSVFADEHAPNHAGALSEEAAKRVYRASVLENLVIPRISTERGKETMVRRWHGIPKDADDDTAHRQLAKQLDVLDDDLAQVALWADRNVPKSRGRSLALPSTAPERPRWCGRSHWRAGAVEALESSASARLSRVGTGHYGYIVAALASFADTSTGRSVTASNSTIGKRAAAMCATDVARGAWSGSPGSRKTSDLGERTLRDNVGAVVAALQESGWINERARGRHLTLRERAAAFQRHKIHQDRAGSVRDLTVPDHQRPRPRRAGRPPAPAWVDERNPHLWQLRVESCRRSINQAIRIPALRTQLPMGELVLLLTLLDGYLTRARARGGSPLLRKTQTRTWSSPSLNAQRLAAALTGPGGMGWLLRKGPDGGRHHHRLLARIIDSCGASHLTWREVHARITGFLAEKHWEIHPDAIAYPLRWLKTVMAGWTLNQSENRQPRGPAHSVATVTAAKQCTQKRLLTSQNGAPSTPTDRRED